MMKELSEEEVEKTIAAANALLLELGGIVERSEANCEVLSVALGKLLAASVTFFAQDEETATVILDGISELAESYIGQFYALRRPDQPVQ